MIRFRRVILSAMSYRAGGEPIASLVRAQLAIRASFSAAAYFTISITSSVEPGQTVTEGSFPSTAHAPSSAGAVETCSAPTISGRREEAVLLAVVTRLKLLPPAEDECEFRHSLFCWEKSSRD